MSTPHDCGFYAREFLRRLVQRLNALGHAVTVWPIKEGVWRIESVFRDFPKASFLLVAHPDTTNGATAWLGYFADDDPPLDAERLVAMHLGPIVWHHKSVSSRFFGVSEQRDQNAMRAFLMDAVRASLFRALDALEAREVAEHETA